MHESQYDLVVFSDACASGWGAYILDPSTGIVHLAQQRWYLATAHSATTEPTAISRLLDLIDHRFRPNLRIAVVTDHVALVTGQRRWFSNHGGVSSGYALNEAFSRSANVDFFYLPGTENPADGPSRDITVSATHLRFGLARCRLPALGRTWHPYLLDDRPIDCV